MRYYAIYVERFCGSPDDPEWHPAECLLGADMSLDELKRSYRSALWGTSRDDIVSVWDETDKDNHVAVPYETYEPNVRL